MRFPLRSCLLVLVLSLPVGGVHAQSSEQGGPPDAEATGPGIHFNGYGRSLLQQTGIGGTRLDADTTTAEHLTDGEFLLDLAVNGQPNDVTEVQGVIRFRNEFGGFFGAGVSVEVRELWARGIIANVLRYRVGDMDLALTPYTLYVPREDGVVNEPELFRPQKDVIYHEAFFTGANERRLQGAHLDFELAFDRGLEVARVQGFLARLRTTDYTTTPNRFIGGGRIAAVSSRFGDTRSQARLGATLAYTWDDLATGQADTGIRNAVTTVDADLTVLDRGRWTLHVLGEAGRSAVVRKREADADGSAETLVDESDTFLEAGVAATWRNPGLRVAALFIDVGPDFFSGAAQSKRVDYTRTKSFFHRIGNDRAIRDVTLFDLGRDRGLYTFRVADQLMPYDPRYGNVLPYGPATPNRRGLRLEARYAPAEGLLAAALDAALLREIRGQGTTELKDFRLVRAEADLQLAPLLGWQRPLVLTLGSQIEQTRRGGEAVEEVDLSSTLVEAGLTAEVYDRLDVLLGAKRRASNGRDYVPQLINFNDVRDFPAPFVTDDREALLGAGLRYRFREGIYLTIQYQRFRYHDAATPAEDYRLGQFFALYSMSF